MHVTDRDIWGSKAIDEAGGVDASASGGSCGGVICGGEADEDSFRFHGSEISAITGFAEFISAAVEEDEVRA